MMRFQTSDGNPIDLEITRALVAGWTGRDSAAVEHHIEELAALGVARPSTIPLYYRVSAQLLTQRDTIEVVGPSTSGEVEPVVMDDGERLWLTLGSDHTDRDLEARSVALSKQICPKPLATVAWPFDAVTDRLDTLELRSWCRDEAEEGWTLYQQGTLAALTPLAELIEGAPGGAGGGLGRGGLMMCGTLPVVSGGIRPARHMRLEMRDPTSGSVIDFEYSVRALQMIF